MSTQKIIVEPMKYTIVVGDGIGIFPRVHIETFLTLSQLISCAPKDPLGSSSKEMVNSSGFSFDSDTKIGAFIVGCVKYLDLSSNLLYFLLLSRTCDFKSGSSVALSLGVLLGNGFGLSGVADELLWQLWRLQSAFLESAAVQEKGKSDWGGHYMPFLANEK